MTAQNLDKTTYVVTPTASSQSLQLPPDDAFFGSIFVYNASTEPVALNSSVASSTISFPITGNSPCTVIPPNTYIKLTKNPSNTFINFIQSAAGTGNLYLSAINGDLIGFSVAYSGAAGGATPVNVTNLPAAQPSILWGFGVSTLAVKASTGTLFACYGVNRNAAASRYLQVYAANNSTAGTPIFSALIAFGGSTFIFDDSFFTLQGIAVSSGITLAISTTSSTYTAPTASEHDLGATYS